MADVTLVRVRNTDTGREEEIAEEAFEDLMRASSNWERVAAPARGGKNAKES